MGWMKSSPLCQIFPFNLLIPDRLEMEHRRVIFLKVEPHLCLLSENSQEHWARIGEQVMCRSICIRAFSVFVIMRWIHSRHFQILRNRRVLANTLCEINILAITHQFMRECWRIIGIHLFSPILQELVYG